MPRRPESDQIGPTFFFEAAPDKNDQSRLYEFDEKRFGPERLKPLRSDFRHFAHQTRDQRRRQGKRLDNGRAFQFRKDLHNSNDGDLPAQSGWTQLESERNRKGLSDLQPSRASPQKNQVSDLF